MNYREAVSAYFQDKIDRAVGAIKGIYDVSTLDSNRKSVETRMRITAPTLDIARRSFKSVQELPTYQPNNVMVQTSTPYTGVEVTIPTNGDSGLFTAFINKRHMCDGFELVANGIRIKQYDFANQGIVEVRERIKACVESLQTSLVELQSNVDFYHATLESELKNAVEARKREIERKAQQDKDADPWG